MTSAKVMIVDYGLGNLYSVSRAFEVCGASEIGVSSDPEEISNAERLVLPGVGAFADGICGLKDRNLAGAICRFAASGRPLLGICLGMQLFATKSVEFGQNEGLNLIPGEVCPIPGQSTEGSPLKIPYVGWALLNHASDPEHAPSILARMQAKDSVYLVHSFQFVTEHSDHVLATYRYGGHDVTAAVRKENITGLQFHPEKSGEVGLSILSDFLKQSF